MIEVLRNKNLTTKFQILVEIADKGSDIHQREIAKSLEITPQAVSDYIAQLVKDGMLASEGRSSFRLTNKGVDWVITALRDLNGYNLFAQRAVNNISVCAAIAEENLKKDRQVGLMMKDGLLYASSDINGGATGVATSNARSGQDIGIANIRGIVPLEIGKVTIAKIPGIDRGGSARVNYDALNNYIKDSQISAALGLEAIVALNKTGTAFYRFGAVEVAIESAKCGLNPLVVCAENEASALVARLEQERIRYELFEPVDTVNP